MKENCVGTKSTQMFDETLLVSHVKGESSSFLALVMRMGLEQYSEHAL